MDALLLFYGVFWGISLATVGRYNAFATHLFWDRTRSLYAFRRFCMAFSIVNLLPILWFAFVLTRVVPDESGGGPILSAGLASLSVFGFIPRLLHALIATSRLHHIFYSEHEWQEMAHAQVRQGPNTFASHLLPGVPIFLVVLPVAAWLMEPSDHAVVSVWTWRSNGSRPTGNAYYAARGPD